MKKISAVLATSAVAAAIGVFAFAAPAQAIPAGCQVYAQTPHYAFTDIVGSGGVAGCSSTVNIKLVVTLWRNNNNGKYTSWTSSGTKNSVTEYGLDADVYCSGISTAASRVWHTETQATVNGVAQTAVNSGHFTAPCV
jgi:hypothetical protein